MTKTPEEIAIMREGGGKLGSVLEDLLEFSVPGVSLLDIDARANARIGEAGGTASFKTVRGYKWTTCLCINDVVVHGIPTEYRLKDGDILTIDIGMLYKGFHTDTAWTKKVKRQKEKGKRKNDTIIERFLEVGEETLWNAIDNARVGNHVGHISEAIGNAVERAGYSIVRSLVGHGVGKTLHEEPQIPGLLRVSKESTLPLVEGMTLAIEVIYALGNGSVVYVNDDGWSLGTKDESLSAVFEHTVAVGRGAPLVLTHALK